MFIVTYSVIYKKQVTRSKWWDIHRTKNSTKYVTYLSYVDKVA
jgi:hypothetical protein